VLQSREQIQTKELPDEFTTVAIVITAVTQRRSGDIHDNVGRSARQDPLGAAMNYPSNYRTHPASMTSISLSDAGAFIIGA
jgi:hypothetical protein